MAILNSNSVIEDALWSSRLRVFHGAHALGNTAACFILEREPNARWQLNNAQADGETWCVLWRDLQTTHAMALQYGNEIRFCGHGLVAAAHAWFHCYNELPLLTMRERSYRTRTQWQNWPGNGSASNGFAVAVTRSDFCSQALDWREYSWFDIAPSLCFSVGKNDDYLLCVWPPGIDIAAIKINFELIAKQARAIIMTQSETEKFSLCVEGNTDFPFDLRYLAPQYGNDEDSATGSAAAIAADFWQNYFCAPPAQHFIAHQRSRSGGEIHCSVDQREIWIGGRVTPLHGFEDPCMV